jgi:sec-independent protein translocase protein TatB
MGIFEMLIIAVVALLVVGPERMPEAVRGAAMTLGRLKRMFNSTKEEFEKQIGAEDIRLELHNEQIMDNLKKMEADFAEIDSDLNKLTQDDEDRLFMEKDNYQDPPQFSDEELRSKTTEPEEPFAFNYPPADEVPSDILEPLAAKESKANKKPAISKKPTATKSPAATKKAAAKKSSTNSKTSAQQTSAKTGKPEDNTVLNKNKSPV